MIGPLEFVPEVYVRLAELEILDVQFCHRARAEEIESGEKPAPPASSLIGDLPLVELYGEGEIDVLHHSTVKCDIEYVVIRNRVLCHLRRVVSRESSSHFLELFLCDRLAHVVHRRSSIVVRRRIIIGALGLGN